MGFFEDVASVLSALTSLTARVVLIEQDIAALKQKTTVPDQVLNGLHVAAEVAQAAQAVTAAAQPVSPNTAAAQAQAVSPAK